MLPIVIVFLVAVLAAANGANDVSKGVATLAGSGVSRYRAAIAWGAGMTFAGALLSGTMANQMLTLFSNGVVSARPTIAFTLATACGALGWVALATWMRLPVSTTHAIVGALLGAGILFAPGSIKWRSLTPKIVVPLLLSILVSFGLTALIIRLSRSLIQPSDTPHNDVSTARDGFSSSISDPGILTKDAAISRRKTLLNSQHLHWLSSGAVSFSRGLNDTPKLVALGALALGGPATEHILVPAAAISMCAGGLWAGQRVARVLAEDILPMNHREGLLANVATALLVGFGANLGLPMSTTHVSAGAIAGISGSGAASLNARTLRDLALAWLFTPLVAGAVAAFSYIVLQRFL